MAVENVDRFRGGFVEHLSRTQVAQQSVTRLKYITITNLVTPKAAIKHDLYSGFVEHPSMA